MSAHGLSKSDLGVKCRLPPFEVSIEIEGGLAEGAVPAHQGLERRGGEVVHDPSNGRIALPEEAPHLLQAPRGPAKDSQEPLSGCQRSIECFVETNAERVRRRGPLAGGAWLRTFPRGGVMMGFLLGLALALVAAWLILVVVVEVASFAVHLLLFAAALALVAWGARKLAARRTTGTRA